MKVPKIADWAGYYALKATPASFCSNFGAAISPLARLTHPAAHQDVLTLFAALRPDWARDPAALEAAARRLWACVGRIYAEFAISHRIVRDGRMTIENLDWVDQAAASGRPVIVAYVHTGCWELCGIALAGRFPNTAVAIYDPPKRNSFAAIALKVRGAVPVELLAMAPHVWRDALARLRQGGALFVAADDFSRSRVGAPLFGRPPWLGSNLGNIARLALRTNAVVVPFYGERHADLRFTTHVLEPMTFTGAANDYDAVMTAIKAMDAVYTPHVLRLLDQWYMALYYRDHASLEPR